MTDPLLDEDGRCRRTDLLPGECGCAGHRGGEVVDLEEEPYVRRKKVSYQLDELTIKYLRAAQYKGQCAIDPGHDVHVGKDIGLAIKESGEEVGWVCAACVNEILTSGVVEQE